MNGRIRPIFALVLLAAISACTHEYFPDEKASWNVQVSLSFTDSQYWPEGQQIRVGAFSADDSKNPVASIGVSKPSGENTQVAIGAVPEGSYQFKVYVVENANYKADLADLGEEAVSSDLSLSKTGIALISFDRVQRQVLNSCILCHGGSSGQLAANLNLMPGKSYAQLVGVSSVKNPAFIRVNPESATYSYLVKVLNKDIDFDHAASSSATVADKQLITDWINEGAKNN